MKRLLFLLSIVILPFAIVIIVNEASMEPSTIANKEYCTRACHNRGCPHFNQKRLDKGNQSFVTRHFDSYKKNIDWLKNNPLDLSYVEINLLIYVILFPIISVLLLWRLIRRNSPIIDKEI